MNIESITNRKDLKKVLQFLEDQGFGYVMGELKFHEKKIDNIISKANTLKIEYDKNKLDREINGSEDYDEIERIAKNFFSKFNPDDKINELINKLSIKEDERCQTPSWNFPDSAEIISWVNFRIKYNLKDEFDGSDYVNYYNFDKKFIKISFFDKFWEFIQLYELIYGEKPKNFADNQYASNSHKYGQWQNIGEIEIKIYQNNTADLRGNIEKLREYYYNYVIKQTYLNKVIRYNGNTEILKNKERRY